MKRIRIRLITIFASSVLAVLLLYFFSSARSTDNFGGFNRKIDGEFVSLHAAVTPKYGGLYVAGVVNNRIAFGSHVVPLTLLLMSYDLDDTVSVHIRTNTPSNFASGPVLIKIDSPRFYLMNGAIPVVNAGWVENWEAYQSIKTLEFFKTANIIGSDGIVSKINSSNSGEDELLKETFSNNRKYLAKELLTKQVDGVFCVDGMLNYNKELNRVIYTYYYRNEIVFADSNLNLLFRGKTIDTVNRAKIKVSTIEADKRITISAPPVVVNGSSCTAGDLLYINSRMLADNENDTIRRTQDVIDVYSIRDGSYRFSFYIPKFNGQQLISFFVKSNFLIIMYRKNIVSYKIMR